MCRSPTSKEVTSASTFYTVASKCLSFHISKVEGNPAQAVCTNFTPSEESLETIFFGSPSTDQERENNARRINCQIVESNKSLKFDTTDTKGELSPTKFVDILPLGYRIINALRNMMGKKDIHMLKNQSNYNPDFGGRNSRSEKVAESDVFTLRLKSGLATTNWMHVKSRPPLRANLARQSLCCTGWPASSVYRSSDEKPGASVKKSKAVALPDRLVYGLAHVTTDYVSPDGSKFVACDFVTLLPQGGLWLSFALLCQLAPDSVGPLANELQFDSLLVLSPVDYKNVYAIIHGNCHS